MKGERLLEELKARLDIVDVISDYVELKRSGQNFKGLCPFHSEKTPSFMVSPEKQIFHCFGCGAGGNSIHFIMKHENLPFHESLRFLAKKAGISLKEYAMGGAGEGIRENLTGILRDAAKVFAENLKRSKAASLYLRERGLSDEIIRTFALGYAVKDWHSLTRLLKQKGISDALILQAGIAASGGKGIYDTFRDRIMFSIAGVQGDVVAFGGRVMDDSQPKYLNSPDTPLFKKGETLYGLNLAKDGIREKGYAMIVEGYFDVILSHQYGFKNAVAPLGTALTPGHLQRLKRFTKKALLVFDGDEAGISAARRSVPLLFEQGFGAKILLLPEKEDPDSFLRKHGGERFDQILPQSKSAIDFILGVSKHDKTETVHEALDIISAAGDAIMREELIRELSEKTGIGENVLREEIKRLSKKLKEKRKAEPHPSPPGRRFFYDEEILLLSAVISFPDRLDYVLRIVTLEDFRNPAVKNIFARLVAGEGKAIDSMVWALAEEEKALVTRLTVHPGFDGEAVDRNIEDCIKRIESRKSEEQRKQLHEQIKKAEFSGERELLDSLLPERQKLIKEAR